MKEVIAKLNELIDTEKTGQDETDNNFANLMDGFKSGLNAIQNAVISSAAASDAQRLGLAMRAEKLAEADARARALAAKEARQEAAEMRKAQLAGAGGATGIDLSQFELKDQGQGKGIVATIIGAITGVVISIVALINKIKNSRIFKKLKGRIANLFKPGGPLGKIGDLFRKGGIFSKIGDLFRKGGVFSKGGSLSKIIAAFKPIGDLFKKGGRFSKIVSLFKKSGIFSKFFSVLGRLGGLLGRLFAPLGIILGAIAGIIDAVKAFQNEDGSLMDKIIAGLGGFFEGFVGFLIGGLLDLGKDLLAWLLGIFGVPDEKLEGMKAFSVTDFLKDLIGNIFDGIDAFFGKLFDGMFEGFNLGYDPNAEGNILDKIIGGIMGFISGWAEGLLEFYSTVIDGIAEFFGVEGFSFKDWLSGFVGDIWNGITGFFKNIFETGKEATMSVIQEYINLGQWIAGFARDIWDNITGFFKDMFDKAKAGADVIGEGLMNIGDALKGFIADLLPDRDTIRGKILSKTGIYKMLGVDGSVPAPEEDTTFVDNSAIIPPKSNVGEALTKAGNMTNATSVTVVNNNGGNVTNTTTSSQTNNTSSASPPVLSGSAMAM